ncbi:hypothetical protein TKK_0006808 [Trichogramma kaykai]
MTLNINKIKFLLNIKNKNNLVQMLKNKLDEEKINHLQCSADADRTIVITAIQLAEDVNKKVVVVSEDRDVLVLITALTPSCDTVSATYGQGKMKFFNIFQNNPDLTLHAKQFKNINMTIENIVEHGCQLVLAMYNAPITFRKLTLSDEEKSIILGKLLPTVDAFTQHLKRVYLQVQNWLFGDNICDPTAWGWEMKDNSLKAIRMTQPPGPPSVISLIFCSCQKDCGNT